MEQTFEARFLSARRAVIAARFQNLNEMQREGVLTTQGPLLLLAGAGSGKTTVLINRIANLIAFGEGSDSNEIPDYIAEADVTYLEDYLKTRDPAMQQQAERLCALRPAAPWSILAITFTNKAANELKARLQALLGDYAMDVWAMTFHAACCRILRREIDRLDGYTGRFTIYDTSDSERVMKDILKDFGLDEKSLPPRLALSVLVVEHEVDRLALGVDGGGVVTLRVEGHVGFRLLPIVAEAVMDLRGLPLRVGGLVVDGDASVVGQGVILLLAHVGIGRIGGGGGCGVRGLGSTGIQGDGGVRRHRGLDLATLDGHGLGAVHGGVHVAVFAVGEGCRVGGVLVLLAVVDGDEALGSAGEGDVVAAVIVR